MRQRIGQHTFYLGRSQQGAEQKSQAVSFNAMFSSTLSAKYTVLINDALTPLEVVAFRKVAEMLVDITANELVNLNNLEQRINVDEINSTLQGQEYMLQIRKKHCIDTYGDIYYYNLVGATVVSNQHLDISNQSPATDVVPLLKPNDTLPTNSHKRCSPSVDLLSRAKMVNTLSHLIHASPHNTDTINGKS